MAPIYFEFKKSLNLLFTNFSYSLFMKKSFHLLSFCLSLIHNKEGYFDVPYVPICLGLKCNCFNDSVIVSMILFPLPFLTSHCASMGI